MDGFIAWLKAEKDRAAGWVLIALGAIAIFIGYQGVADSPYVAEELAYIASGAVGGMFLLGVGATLLITADIRDEWRKLDRIDRALNEGVDVRAILTEEPTNGSEPAAPPPPTPARRGRARAGVMNMRTAGSGEMAIDRGQAITTAAMLPAALLIAIGWWIAGDNSDPQDAIRALAGGVSGLLVTAVVAAAGILWMRRTVFIRRNRVFGPWFLHEATEQMAGQRRAHAAAAADATVLTAPGLTRYHRPGCSALDGVAGIRRRRLDQVGDREPCGLCDIT